MMSLRRRQDLLQHTVDPEPHCQALLPRLYVDVARPLLNRLKQDQVDQTDDRRVVRVYRELLRVDVASAGDRGLDVNDALDALLDGDGVAVVLVDRGRDVVCLGGSRRDQVAGVGLDGVRRDDVERIGHRQDEGVALLPPGHQLEPLGHLAGYEPHDMRVDLHADEAQLLGLVRTRSLQVSLPPVLVTPLPPARTGVRPHYGLILQSTCQH
jgi:hypothetical protein